MFSMTDISFGQVWYKVFLSSVLQRSYTYKEDNWHINPNYMFNTYDNKKFITHNTFFYNV